MAPKPSSCPADPSVTADLRRWLDSEPMTQSAFALAIGLSGSLVSTICAGRQSIPIRLRAKVEELTGISASRWRTEKQIVRGASREALGDTIKQVPFFPRYFVSNAGRLYSDTLMGFNEVKPWGGKRFTAIMTQDGEQKAVPMARLVALLHIGSPPDDDHDFVCHRDDNPKNNNVDNLYWGTQKQNIEDARRNGKLKTNANDARVRLAIGLSGEGKTVGEIGRILGLNDGTVGRILRGESWLHIEGERKINVRDVLRWQIIDLARQGVRAKEIKKRLGIENEYHYQIIARARRAGLLDGGKGTRVSADDIRAVNALHGAGFNVNEVAARLHMCAMIVGDIVSMAAKAA